MPLYWMFLKTDEEFNEFLSGKTITAWEWPVVRFSDGTSCEFTVESGHMGMGGRIEGEVALLPENQPPKREVKEIK